MYFIWIKISLFFSLPRCVAYFSLLLCISSLFSCCVVLLHAQVLGTALVWDFDAYGSHYCYYYSSPGSSGKSKLFMSRFHNPISTCATENRRKYDRRKQPTVDCTLEPIQLSIIKNIVWKAIPHSTRPSTYEGHSGRKHLANWDVLHLDTSNSNGWAAASAHPYV